MEKKPKRSKQQIFVDKQRAIGKKCKIGKCLIIKGGYYYRDNYCGYTEYIQYAGVYTVEDALSHVCGCSYTDFISIIPIDPEKHNRVIIDHIKTLSGHLV